MEEFLLKNYSTIINLIEFVSAVTGVFYFKKYKGTAATFFVYYLIYIFLIEFVGKYSIYVQGNGFLSALKGTLFEYNYWFFNVFWYIGGPLFFGIYYQRVLENQTHKKVLKIITALFVVSSISIFILNFKNFFRMWFIPVEVMGAIVVLLAVVFYFFELLKSDKILYFYKSLNFYITASIFVFWLIITPLVFYNAYFSTSDWNFVFLRREIYLFANVFMYSVFTIGLIVSKSENNFK